MIKKKKKNSDHQNMTCLNLPNDIQSEVKTNYNVGLQYLIQPFPQLTLQRYQVLIKVLSAKRQEQSSSH